MTDFSRRDVLQAGFTGTALALLPRIAMPSSSEVQEIGTVRQLFFDDSLIDLKRSSGIIRRLNPAMHIRRVLKPERPSEALGMIFYCSVVDDQGTAKLYYGSYDAEKKKHFSLAISSDGLNWERPDLRLVEYRGSKGNNLFPLDAVEASVFLDPHAALPKRYRLLYSRDWPDPDKAGIYLASSPDGITWNQSETRLLPFVPDSQHCGVWDPAREKYIVYTWAWNPVRSVARIEVDDLEAPWPVARSVPPHHIWGKDKVPTLSREYTVVLAPDERDAEGVQIYTNAVSRYSASQADVYLAFPAMYQTFNNEPWKDRALNVNDGQFDVQLATSRDGILWNRWREPYVSAGYHDGLDLRLVSMGQGIVRRGRHLYQYFVGWPHTHGRPVVWDRNKNDREIWLKKDLGGIYCARQRVDGFISMNAGASGGTLTTHPFTLSGDVLKINFHAQGSGGVSVSLLGADGNPLHGYDDEDSPWMSVDSIDHAVHWKSGRSLQPLVGRAVRIRFRMQNARLFSFRVSKSDA